MLFALPSFVTPSLGALGSCPSRQPLDPPLLLCPLAALHLASVDTVTYTTCITLRLVIVAQYFIVCRLDGKRS